VRYKVASIVVRSRSRAWFRPKCMLGRCPWNFFLISRRKLHAMSHHVYSMMLRSFLRSFVM